MLNYYFRIALVSFRRHWTLTLLVVVAIAMGVALTMTAYTVLSVMSRDPISWKSSQLFAVQLDNGGPRSRKAGDNEPEVQLTYRDATALLNARQVTVVSLSNDGHEVTLRREGSGVGEGLDGKRTITIKRDGKDFAAKVQLLKTRWSGYSVYRDGILMSDELLTTSDVVAVAPGLASIPGKARQYVLMNAASEIAG
ncbi:MAG TPA: hypothetical protein VHW71_07965 [Steroidobacteraceae bacterium]|jgi:hypothetical protein|nr:hypothetical protein [Steroidobacteraceae bacterium]